MFARCLVLSNDFAIIDEIISRSINAIIFINDVILEASLLSFVDRLGQSITYAFCKNLDILYVEIKKLDFITNNKRSFGNRIRASWVIAR